MQFPNTIKMLNAQIVSEREEMGRHSAVLSVLKEMLAGFDELDGEDITVDGDVMLETFEADLFDATRWEDDDYVWSLVAEVREALESDGVVFIDADFDADGFMR